MAEKELKIKVKAELSELQKARQAVNETANAFLKLKADSTVSADALNKAASAYDKAVTHLNSLKAALNENTRLEKAHAQAIIENVKRTNAIQDDYVKKQIANINYLAQRKQEAENKINKEASQRLLAGAQQNRIASLPPPTELQKARQAVNETANAFLKLKADSTVSGDAIKQAGEKFKQAQLNLRGAKDALKEVGDQTGKTSSGFSGMTASLSSIKSGVYVLAFLAIADAIKNIATSALSAAEEIGKIALKGAQFNILKQGFETIQGGAIIAKQNLELLNTALAGNLPNTKVMELANSFKLLGIDTKTTAQVFDFAERNTEVLGGTIEEVIEKVRKFAVTGTGKGFEQFGVKLTDINKKVKESTGLTQEQIKALSEETQTRLKLTAFAELYGNSLDEIKGKQKDESDAITFLVTQYENFKVQLASFLSTALKPVIAGIQELINFLGKMVSELLGGEDGIKKLVQGFQNIAKGIMSAVIPALKTMVSYYASIAKGIKNIIDENQALINTLAKAGKVIIKGLGDVFTTYVNSIGKVISFSLREISAFLGLVTKGIIFALEAAKFLASLPTNISGISPEKIQNIIDSLKASAKDVKEANLGTRSKKETIEGLDMTPNKKNEKEKEVDLVQQLIDKINLAFETAKEFRTLTLQLFDESIKELKLQLGITTDLKDRLKLQKEINKVIGERSEFLELKGLEIRELKEPSELKISRRTLREPNPRALLIAEQEAAEEAEGMIIGAFEQSLSLAQSIHSLFGEGGAFIVNAFQTAYGLVQQIIALFNTIGSIFNLFSFIPGVGAIAAVAGGGGASLSGGGLTGNNVLGGHGSMMPNLTVIVNSEVERTKAIKFYRDTFPSYNNREARTTL